MDIVRTRKKDKFYYKYKKTKKNIDNKNIFFVFIFDRYSMLSFINS